MKKTMSLLLLLVMILFLIACDRTAEQELGFKPVSDHETDTGLSSRSDQVVFEGVHSIKEQALDFKSVLDHETGTVFSLGESRTAFEDVLGAGIPVPKISPEDEIARLYSYADGLLSVRFYDEKAVEIVVSTHGGEGYERFEFYAVSWEMRAEDLTNYPPDQPIYIQYFNEFGEEPITWDEIVYLIAISELYLISDGRLEGLMIRLADNRFWDQYVR